MRLICWRSDIFPIAGWAGFGLVMWAFVRILPPPPKPRPMVFPPSRPGYGIHLPPIVIGLGVACLLAFYLYLLTRPLETAS